MRAGVCGHQHKGAGGQSWNPHPRHHPSPALLRECRAPGVPGSGRGHSACGAGLGGARGWPGAGCAGECSQLEQGTGGAPQGSVPADTQGGLSHPRHTCVPRDRPCRWPRLCPARHGPAVAQLCRALGGRELLCRGALTWFREREQDNPCWVLRCHVWLSGEPETEEFVNTSCRRLSAAF